MRWTTDPDEILESALEALADERRPRVPTLARPIAPDPDLRPMRVRAAWRIARESARLQGWLTLGEPLASLFEREDALSDPDAYFYLAPRASRSVTLRDEAELRREVSTGLEPLPEGGLDPRAPLDRRLAQRWLRGQGLLPPPRDFTPQGDPAAPDYPFHLPDRARWLAVLAPVSWRLPLTQDLRLRDGHSADSAQSWERYDGPRRAWGEMFVDLPDHPDTWPTREEVLQEEDLLVQRAVEERLQGAARARRWMTYELALAPHEVGDLEVMARRRALDLTQGDVEEKRAMMELRLEDLAKRARDDHGDVRCELGAVKALAVVQGITRAEPETLDAEFVKIARAALPPTITAKATMLGPAREALDEPDATP